MSCLHKLAGHGTTMRSDSFQRQHLLAELLCMSPQCRGCPSTPERAACTVQAHTAQPSTSQPWHERAVDAATTHGGTVTLDGTVAIHGAVAVARRIGPARPNLKHARTAARTQAAAGKHRTHARALAQSPTATNPLLLTGGLSQQAVLRSCPRSRSPPNFTVAAPPGSP